jgi:CDP-glycerol glycerophosphotransferase (TagB/SpsB family)
VFRENYQYIKAEYIGEGNKAFARLNFLAADVVLMTAPGLDVYQIKRSKTVKHYAHVLHMPHDATRYEMFGLDYFDSVLLTGDYQAKDIRKLEQIRNLSAKKLVTVGCTYLDVYAEKIKQIPAEENHPFTVLVSPTWGTSGLLSRYGERLLDPLVQAGWRIIVRPHPQSKRSDAPVLEILSKRYNAALNLEWDYERDNIYSLVKADIMISDFSGIIFDYVFLRDRPVIYVNEKIDLRPYDAGFIDDELWLFRAAREIGVELQEEMFNAITDVISRVSDGAALKQARQKAKETAWQHRGEAGKQVAEFMINGVS